MKHSLLPVFLLIFISAAFMSGCKGQVKTPGITFASNTFNFGTIEEGKSINHVFEFTNSGTGTLVVTEVKPTCGCTITGDYDKEIQPGQKGRIPVTFKSAGFDGPLAKAIIVKTNVPDQSDLTITLVGIVKVSVNVNPGVLSFGNIYRNRTEPLKGRISISNRLSEPVRITDVIKTRDAIEIPNMIISNENAEATVDVIQDGFEYSLIVTVKPPFKYGQVMGSFLLRTDSEIVPEIGTRFSYFMEPIVKIFPNPLFVSKDMIAKGVEQLINIECEPGPDMLVADYSVNIPEVKISLKEVERGRKYRLLLRFPRDFEFDPSNTLTVKFKAQNVPDEPVFGVPVLGM